MSCLVVAVASSRDSTCGPCRNTGIGRCERLLRRPRCIKRLVALFGTLIAAIAQFDRTGYRADSKRRLHGEIDAEPANIEQGRRNVDS